MNGASPYDVLASFYGKHQEEALLEERWAKLVPKQRVKQLKALLSDKATDSMVLDLACGQGEFLLALAQEGIRGIGVDLSFGMLNEAWEKVYEMDLDEALRPQLLQGDMRSLDLGLECEVVTCLTDGLNHLLTTEELRACLATVRRHLRQGGYFLFDVLSEAHFVALPPVSVERTAEQTLIWQSQYNADHQLNVASLEVFERQEDGLYLRETVEIQERIWTLNCLLELAEEEALVPLEGLEFPAVEELVPGRFQLLLKAV